MTRLKDMRKIKRERKAIAVLRAVSSQLGELAEAIDDETNAEEVRAFIIGMNFDIKKHLNTGAMS